MNVLALAIGGVLLAALVSVSCGALVEVFRQLAEIRTVLNLEDRPLPLAIGGGELRTTALGLPEHLEQEPELLIVFLSGKCSTCLAIAEAFRGGSPSSVWFVVDEATNSSRLRDSLHESAERVIVDVGSATASRTGLEVTPAVLTAHFGQVARAHAVSSPRQVMAMIPVVASRIGPPVPVNGATLADDRVNAIAKFSSVTRR